MISNKAFILAAGFGKRMRPLTNDIPKPMVKVQGTPMIDLALDKLHAAGIDECVINTHYKAKILEKHLKNREAPKIHLSHEPEILDTGGGIKNAIAHFSDPFFILSGDSVWEDASESNTLETLKAAWNPEHMDILMLLQPVETMTLTKGVGDYDIDEHGRAVRSLDKTGRYMFTSIRINAPSVFEGAPDEPFNYRDLMDIAQEKGRLFGLVHKGAWHHISTPEDLEAVNKNLESDHKRG
ncbi:MAG: nucleotidyltransferase family protein [Pseudomonadota bacterium]